MSKVKDAKVMGAQQIIAYYVFPIVMGVLFLLQSRTADSYGRMVISALFLGAGLAAALGILLHLTIKWMKRLGYTSRDYAVIAVTLLLVAGGIGAFLFFTFSQEKDIKTYDFSNYWIRTLEMRSVAADSLTELIKSTASSLHSDYTYLATLPLIPLSYIFGIEYFGYTFSVFIVYCLPACLFLALYAMRLIHKAKEVTPSVVTFATCILFGAICPGILWPLLNGYLDICGVLIMALMLNITLNWNGTTFSWRHVVTLSVLSVLMLLMRRWYAYYIVGFYMGLGVDLLISMSRQKRFSFLAIKGFMINMGLLVVLSCLLILVLDKEIFRAFLFTDYSAAYAMAKTKTWWQNVWQIMQWLGLLWVAASLAGMAILLKNKKTRLLAIRLIVASVIAFVLFFLVQNLEWHHFYLVIPAVLVFVYVFCDATVQFMRQEKAPVFTVTLIAVSIANFALPFFPALERFYAAMLPFTSYSQYYPKVNPYFEMTHKIVDDLKQEIGETSSLTYVVGATESLSSEVLKRIYLPSQIDGAPYVMYNHISDSRDGFPSQLFLADYVLVNDPFESSYETIQQVNFQVHDMLLNDDQVKSYYEEVKSYGRGNTGVLMFKKTQPTDTALVDNLKERMLEHYPDMPLAYEPDYAIALFQYDRADKMEYDYWGENFNFIHDGKKAIEFGWADTSKFTRLQFQMRTDTTPMEMKISNQDGELMSVAYDEQMWEDVELDITGSEHITVEVTPLAEGETDSMRFYVNLLQEALQ